MIRALLTVGILYFIFHVEPEVGVTVLRVGAEVLGAIVSGISSGIAQV